VTSFSAADLILACNTGGRVRFDTKQEEESWGTYHEILEANRSTTEILSLGTSPTFADVDFSPYTPYGVKGVLIRWTLQFDGDGTKDVGAGYFRKKGSSETDDEKLAYQLIGFTNLSGGLSMYTSGDSIVACDLNGIIQYKVYQAKLSCVIKGYWI
jgi:hypothetical protein